MWNQYRIWTQEIFPPGAALGAPETNRLAQGSPSGGRSEAAAAPSAAALPLRPTGCGLRRSHFPGAAPGTGGRLSLCPRVSSGHLLPRGLGPFSPGSSDTSLLKLSASSSTVALSQKPHFLCGVCIYTYINLYINLYINIFIPVGTSYKLTGG